MAFLEVIKGHKRRRVEIREDNLAIGRSPECHLVLDNRAVSRRHAIIRREGDLFTIEDQRTVNHTFLNGVQLPAATVTPISHRDTVRICHYEFVFHADDATSTDRYDVQIVLTEPADDSSVIRQLHEPAAASTPTGSKDSRIGHKLPAVQAIMRDLAGSATEDELLPKLLDSLFTIFPQAERGYILLKDASGATLTPKATRSRHGEDDSLHVSKAIVERVLENGQALLIDDAPQDPEFGKNPSVINYNIRSIMCAPLASPGNAPLGIIQIHTEDRRQLFKHEDLETLVNVATIAAFKLENDRMHRELRARERVKIEKNAAIDVQRAFLPAACPNFSGYCFDAYYKSAGDVGGDYYDFIVLDNDRVVVTLGDVSGKGLAAALLMVHLRSDVRSAAKSCAHPTEVVQAVNRSLCEAGPAEKFVSLLYLVLDTRRHELSVITAGHPPPLLRTADGTITQIGREESGPLLKFSPDHKYETTKLNLSPGSLVLLYTDGVIDALNAKQNGYKLERLRKTFQAAATGAEDVLDAIVADLHRFTGDAPQFDDIAMICFGRNPA